MGPVKVMFRRDIRPAPAAGLTRRKFLRPPLKQWRVQAAKISVRPAQTQPCHPFLPPFSDRLHVWSAAGDSKDDRKE